MLQRINVMVPDEAKEKLKAYQRKHALPKQDDAVAAILKELKL